MSRPLLVIGISYLFATWFAFSFDGPNALLLAGASALNAGFCFLLRKNKKRALVAGIAFVACSAAFASYAFHFNRVIAPLKNLIGKTVTVEGIVTDVDYGAKSTSYMMKATFPEYPGVKRQMPFMIRSIAELEQAPGDVIRCSVKLVAPSDSIWYKSRGIVAIGQNAREPQSIPAGAFRYERAMIRLREFFTINVYAKLPERSANIVAAMVLGMKSDIPQELYTAVGRAGTAHLLSISGLHLSILCAFMLTLLKAFRCPNSVSAAIAIAANFLFAGLVGFSAPVFRAFVMTAAMLFGRILSKRSDSLNSLGAALLLCCLIWPHWALSWGQWLSAGSTLGIILFAGPITSWFCGKLKQENPIANRLVRFIGNAGGISIAAYAFTLPVLLLMSGWISLVSPLSNILVTPFVPVTILGGIACAVLPGSSAPAKAIAVATDFSTGVIIRVSEIFSDMPFAIIAIDESWILLWLLGLCAFAAVLIRYRDDKMLLKKLAAYAVALALVCYAAGDLSLNLSNRRKVELITFSSRNAAVLIRENEAVILGAPDPYEITNLLRYLNFRGIRSIPAVIAADHKDQIGSGMLKLAGEYKIDCVVAPNDAYIAGELQTALPKSIVYSGGYAEITVLGGVEITTDLQNDNIYIWVGKNEIVKMRKECDIIDSGGGIMIFDGGTMLLPKRVTYAFEPVGAHIFGESRVLLNI